MERRAFKMFLKDGCATEYKKRHDEIWQDLVEFHSDSGISEYSIFLDESTNSLFAFLKAKKYNRINEMPDSKLLQKWWAYMKDLMETNPDNSPVLEPLKEVFFMD